MVMYELLIGDEGLTGGWGVLSTGGQICYYKMNRLDGPLQETNLFNTPLQLNVLSIDRLEAEDDRGHSRFA